MRYEFKYSDFVRYLASTSVGLEWNSAGRMWWNESSRKLYSRRLLRQIL